MRLAGMINLLPIALAGPAWGEPPEAWRAARLDLVLTVDPARERLGVEGTLELVCEAAGSEGPTLAVNARKPAMRFQRVSARGLSARVSLDGSGPLERARLERARPFERGERVTVSFALASAAESSQLQMNADAFYASWVERWYPVVDGGGGTGSPVAPGTTTLRLPRGWRSVSNGERVASHEEGGRLVERWQVDAPAARSFVAAPFVPARPVEAGGRSIAFHLLRSRSTSDAQAAALAGALAAMERRFGPYPYATYHVAEVPESAAFAAGSEQGFIMVRSSILDDLRGSLPLFAHEAAHGWWGNLVRSEGPGAKMLSEALAQYGAVLSIEALEGEGARNEFLRFSRPGYNPLQCALGYFHIWREGGDAALASLADAPTHHNLSDSKGMWFYHMLRGRMGDAAFFEVLRALIDDFRGSEIGLDVFRQRLLAADPSLAGFLRQWLDRTGAPVLRADWWSVDRGKGIEITIEQLQEGEPFEVPLELAVATAGGGEVRHTLTLAERSQRFTLAVPARPLDLRLDPDDRLLLWRPAYGPRPGGASPRQ